MNNNSDNSTEAHTDEAINDNVPALMEITLDEILVQHEESLFIHDNSKQWLIKGTSGEPVNLSDLLPADSEPGEWMKARGSVTVDGVQYEVYHHSGLETELLVQVGMQIASLE
ncbi:Biofilm associated protein A [Enterobacter asburiae]